jgi:hypothetical protein
MDLDATASPVSRVRYSPGEVITSSDVDLSRYVWGQDQLEASSRNWYKFPLTFDTDSDNGEFDLSTIATRGLENPEADEPYQSVETEPLIDINLVTTAAAEDKNYRMTFNGMYFSLIILGYSIWIWHG